MISVRSLEKEERGVAVKNARRSHEIKMTGFRTPQMEDIRHNVVNAVPSRHEIVSNKQI